ncbi:MAG: alpha-glucosidase/alpha-galactosidase [Oscillospiraceae bacterium]|nr:alpha-glucosidase/alpha-galactosidase [Oscillospiraceae bacterium]
MKYVDNRAEGVKIAYIGGGSRGWAWNLMSDLAMCEDMSGDVYLYDIDFEAAQHNEIIGNMYNGLEGAKSQWNYHAAKTAQEAMTGANFVVISILPGTFDEMESDVHTPEKYGIYQSVGDTSGPGGIVRAMRTIPMFEEIAGYVKQYCPDAWVINYTNPMTLCVKALYQAFPEIKAFGCCHEVFGTQKVLCTALKEFCDIEVADRSLIRVNPVGVNHFTWLTKATYLDQDLFPVYAKFAEEYAETGYTKNLDTNWMNNCFVCSQKVKLDLFRKYGWIAAAGDRHLAEFVDGSRYLKNPETVRAWGFGLTTVAFRKEDLKKRLTKSQQLMSGERELKLVPSGEEGVAQMRAILGIGGPLVTNVNIPNRGQTPNLPMGAVVETNAVFRDNEVTPVMSGEIPGEILPLISRISIEQEGISEAIANRDLDAIFEIFANDPLVTCSYDDAKKLFKEMVMNTAKYLTSYDLSKL